MAFCTEPCAVRAKQKKKDIKKGIGGEFVQHFFFLGGGGVQRCSPVDIYKSISLQIFRYFFFFVHSQNIFVSKTWHL
jgi:hypothetical protein